MGEKKILVAGTGERSRLDVFLAEELGFSRSRVKKLIEAGQVNVNETVKNCNYRVIEGDSILVDLPDKQKSTLEAQDIQFEILHTADSYAVINKPPGIVVHPAPGNKSGTLLNGLLGRFPDPHLVHRLDKDTSGVMVIALDEKSALDLRRQFKSREVKKVYSALVEGVIPEEAGEICVPIKRSVKDPTRMSVGWTDARKSITRFRVKEKLNNATLVEIYLLTGRTHQIRVHFSYYGYPVVGDKKYGQGTIPAPRQMLHACQISFRDPASGERVYHEAPVPQDFTCIKTGLGCKL
ncbi:MAG: RluA family pseudouridine synthase [Elusimicrobiota bacterium]